MQELVEAIRRGEHSRLEELCTRNKGLLYTISRRYRGACERDRAVSEEDLIQVGFLGLLEAAEAWNPERGAWASLAAMYIKKAMREVLGIRSSRIRAEHGALSLDRPISEDGDTTLLDTLEDAGAPAIDAQLIQTEIQRSVRGAIEQTSCPLIIQRFDLEGHTYRQIAGELGMHPHVVQSKRHRALSEMRRNRSLQQWIDMNTRFYAHKGVAAFNTDRTSTTEAAAMWRIMQR